MRDRECKTGVSNPSSFVPGGFRLWSIVVVAALGASLIATSAGAIQGPCGCVADPECHRVRDAFHAYQAALLAQNGQAAATRATKGTLAYYRRVQLLALHADRNELEGLTPGDQMIALLLREQIEPAALRAMPGRDVFARAVDEGWIGREKVERQEVGAVEVHGESAKAHITVAGRPAGGFSFLREDGGWRIDLVEMMPLMDMELKLMALRAGVTEHEFAVLLVEKILGRKVQAWDPPFPRRRATPGGVAASPEQSGADRVEAGRES